MKKIILKLDILLMSLVLAMVCFCPLINVTIANAQTDEVVKYSLVPSIYNADGKAFEKYNIESSTNLYPFQPFDFEKKERREGYSFLFNQDSNYRINNQYVKVDEQQTIDKDTELSLFLWIYFDNVYVHNLKITLEFENGSTLMWQYSNVELLELLEGNQTELNVIPYAWNQFELKFSSAEKTGNICDENSFLQVSKMFVDYTSEFEINKVSQIMMYDVFLAPTSKEYKVINDSQKYNIGEAVFYSEEILNSLCVGDSLTVLSPLTVIQYAWQGTKNLKADPQITKQIVLQYPDGTEKVFSTGNKITFEEEGEYKLSYWLYNTFEEDNVPVASFSQKIEVGTIKGVYFDKSSKKVEVGKKYVIKVNASSKLNDVTDFSFESSSSNVVFNYKGDGVLEFYVKKAGKYVLTSSVQGTRPASPEAKTYEAELKIEAYNKEDKNNKALKIFLWVALGILVVGLAIYGIISLVKSNKYIVK